ncbi:MAG: hypothetical protein ACLVJ6_03235 [Merdibacter sp.]
MARISRLPTKIKPYVKPAKALVFIADELLGNNAEKANQIVAQFAVPVAESLSGGCPAAFPDKEAVRMNADGTITLNFQNGNKADAGGGRDWNRPKLLTEDCFLAYQKRGIQEAGDIE